MNPVISGNGEIALMCDDPKIVAYDGLEQWQIDQLVTPTSDSKASANMCLQTIDQIPEEWVKGLTQTQWQKIKRQRSLFGIKLPDSWIKVWRFILKEPNLRDSERASRGGKALGSYSHLWNVWSMDCIDRYLSPMEKDLLNMVDMGIIYSEIGEIMLGRYGDKFWKTRKATSKTTPSQVVNNYLYWKMPNKIARSELTELALSYIKNKKAPV